ncbi:hypothetical protein [Streptomyces anulatus]|uniref:hypothetical protein n=1 Tax=Streptomyces anulatus TaxID=1892 RepID=UPI00364E4B21
MPYATYFPDFLTPPVESGSISVAAGIDRVLSTPRRQLRSEMALLAASGEKPFAGAALALGDVEALRLLGDGLRTYHEAFLAPAWDRIGSAAGADVSWRSRALVTGGTRALLDTFRPMAVWLRPKSGARRASSGEAGPQVVWPHGSSGTGCLHHPPDDNTTRIDGAGMKSTLTYVRWGDAWPCD